AVARFAGSNRVSICFLGLAPQALRCRPLRGLKSCFYCFLGLAPQALRCRPLRGLKSCFYCFLGLAPQALRCRPLRRLFFEFGLHGFAATLCCRRRWISFFINSTSLASGWSFKKISNSSAASLYRFN